MTTEERKVNRKQRTGVVVSDHGDKTVVVSVERASRHRLYRKVIRRTKRYHVHDAENEATMGDLVRIEECRPISRTKHWRLVEVLTEREVAEVAPESIDEALVSDVQRSAARASAEEEGDAEQGADAATATPEATTSSDEAATAEGDDEESTEGDGEAPSEDAPAADDESNDEPEAEAAGDAEKQAE
ncbi:MAG: 30S ribosomal protein S17 [Dehalococcoidia bacterium]